MQDLKAVPTMQDHMQDLNYSSESEVDSPVSLALDTEESLLGMHATFQPMTQLPPGTEERLSATPGGGSQADALLWREEIVDLQGRMLKAFRSMEQHLRREHAREVADLLACWPDEAELASMSEEDLRAEWTRRFDQDRQMQRWLHALEACK